MIYLVLIFGLVLRLVSLNQSFWLDEATTLNVASQFSFIEIITKFSPGDFHPPLYYLLLKLWTSVFGMNEISARMFSVLAGLASIYFVYLIGKKLVGKKVGLVSALLLATSGLHIYYSQEARMYGLACLFVLLAIYSFMLIQKMGKKLSWLIFSLSLPLIFLTDYVSFLLVPVFWLMAINKPKSWLKKFVLSQIPLVLSFLIWTPTLTRQLTAGIGVKTALPGWWSLLGGISPKEIALVPVKFAIGRISFDNQFVYGAMALLPILLFSYLAFRSIRKSKIVWLWLFVPLILAAIVSLFIPVFYYFRLLFVLPAMYLLVALGLNSIKSKFGYVLLILVLLINLTTSGIYLFTPRFHREDWRGLLKFVEREGFNKSYAVVFPAGSQQEAYRYYGGKVVDKEMIDKNYDQVWLVRYVQEIFDPSDSAREKIEGLGYNKTLELNFNGVVVWRYENYENRN